MVPIIVAVFVVEEEVTATSRAYKILNKWRARLVTNGQLHWLPAPQPVVVRNRFAVVVAFQFKRSRRHHHYNITIERPHRHLQFAEKPSKAMKSSGPDRPDEQRLSRNHCRLPLRLQATIVLLLLLDFVSSTLALRNEVYRETYTDDAIILEGKDWGWLGTIH